VYQVLAQLVRHFGQPLRPFFPFRRVRQQVWVFDAYHGRTGAAGYHHGVVCLEYLNGAPGQIGGLPAKATVEEWLAAAGLLGRKVNFAACPS
jgi:hypothetical protein